MPDIYEVKQKLNSYKDRLRMALVKKVEFMRLRYEKCMSSSVFKEPTRRINDNYMKIDIYIKQIENIIKQKCKNEKTRYIELVSKLDALSPLKTLSRGYSLAEKNNKIIKSVKQLNKGDEFKIRFADGKISAKYVQKED